MTLLLCALVLGILPSADEGDAHFARIDYPAALASYERGMKEHPGSPDLSWRIARVCVCMAEVAEEPERGEWLSRGEESARMSIRADSLRPEAYVWLAAALGYRAYFGGGKDQVTLSWEILRLTDRAVELDPGNDAAFSIRGSVYRALGNAGWLKRQLALLFIGPVPEGGFPEGEKALRKAISLAPEVMRHRYELGVLYLDWGKEEEAMAEFRAAEGLPPRVAIDRPRLEKIREFLGREKALPASR
jgi:tetratricopeptide (TPR) repeat protein